MKSQHNSKIATDSIYVEHIAVTTVIATIAIAAIAYGGVRPTSEPMLILGGALLTGMVLLFFALGKRIGHLAIPLSLLSAFALLLVIQSLPLPNSIISFVSPKRLEAVTELTETSPKSLSLSYYSPATYYGLRMFMLGSAVFTAVAIGVTTPKLLKYLLLGLFLIGTAESLLSIAQISSGATGIYWSDLSLGKIRSGSFVNHSNFAQFLNLTSGAGLGLLLVRLSEDRHNRIRNSSKELLKHHWWLIIGLALHATAIALSLSRGGILGMTFATMLVLLMLSRQQKLGWQLWALIAVLPLVFGALVFTDFDAFYDRLATLERQDQYTDRWELGLATLRLAAEHLLAGVGLDAYTYVFPAYDTTGSSAVAEQADNDYVQLIAETGVIGVTIVIAFLLTLGRNVFQGLTKSNDSTRYALYGVAYGLLAIAVQSVTDFGQRVPAVFCVTSSMCGVCYAVSTSHKNKSVYSPMFRSLVTAGLAIISLGAWGWASIEAAADYRADRWWAIAYDLESQTLRARKEADPQSYIDLVAAAEMASQLRPENIEYAYWLNVYRWETLMRLNNGDEQAISKSPQGREFIQQIVNELAIARNTCPTYGPAYSLEGRLRLSLEDESGVRLIQLGSQLMPNNASAVFDAAQIGATEKEPDYKEVLEMLDRVISLDGSLFEEVALYSIEVLERPDWARQLAGDNENQLLQLSRLLNELDRYEELAKEIESTISKNREGRVLGDRARPGEIVSMAKQRVTEEDNPEAIRLYRKALASDYANISWRLELIDILVDQQLYEEAMHEARICIRVRPGSNEVRRRFEEISLLIPATVDNKLVK